jgi:hypothetical protein
VKREKPFRRRMSDSPVEDLKVHSGSVLLMIALALFFTYIFTAADNGVAFGDFRMDIYTNAGKWIKENTESTASVAVPEIGIVGYYAGRTIIDPVGLVTPEMGTLETQQNWDYLIKNFKPDYILAQPQHSIPPQQLSPGAHHPRFKGLGYRYILVKHFIEPHISVEIWKRERLQKVAQDGNQ